MLVALFTVLVAIPPPLARAIAAMGGDAGIDAFPPASILMLGTSDLSAVDQGFAPDKRQPQRFQETVLIDSPNRRAAVRWETSWSDGSPNTWRYTVDGDSGYSLKVKTGRITPMSAKTAAQTLERTRWRIAPLAVQIMRQNAERLRCESATLCHFATEDGVPFDVIFDATTGDLRGYAYTAETQRGIVPIRFTFKAYVKTSIGRFPSGYTYTINGVTNRDVNLVDVRRANVTDDAWLKPGTPDAKPISTVTQTPPASVEKVAEGVWLLRNVGGYNTMFAITGDCVAVFDAPASFPNLGGPIPSPQRSTDLASVIVEKVRETTGRKVCYVIPTHHHSDHFGGVAGFARAGAAIVTTPGSERLAHIVAGAGAHVITVSDRRSFGDFEARVITNDTHAEEMLFIYFPKLRIGFEGDLSDYVVSSRNLLRYIDANSLTIDRFYSAHSASPSTLEELNYAEPAN